MARAPTVIVSHWHQLLEDLEASPMEFYASLEEALAHRRIAGARASRVEWHEGGILSPMRQYLRVERGEVIIDVCGAPFGTGFFVSWWLGEMRMGPLALVIVVGGLLLGMALALRLFGLVLGVVVILVGIPALLWVLVRRTPERLEGWDDVILAVPWFGYLYARFLRPQTYYRLDTRMMFQDAVHGAVLEVVDELTTAKGMRALSELERKPTMRELFGRSF